MHSNQLLKEKYETLLTEKKLKNKARKDVIRKFIKFAKEFLGLKKAPKIFMNHDELFGSNNKSFGHFLPDQEKIVIAVSNRNLADILRTLGHELVHCKQLEENRIDIANPAESGRDGSEIENEANAKAAVMMREFGRSNPEIYE